MGKRDEQRDRQVSGEQKELDEQMGSQEGLREGSFLAPLLFIDSQQEKLKEAICLGLSLSVTLSLDALPVSGIMEK